MVKTFPLQIAQMFSFFIQHISVLFRFSVPPYVVLFNAVDDFILFVFPLVFHVKYGSFESSLCLHNSTIT